MESLDTCLHCNRERQQHPSSDAVIERSIGMAPYWMRHVDCVQLVRTYWLRLIILVETQKWKNRTTNPTNL